MNLQEGSTENQNTKATNKLLKLTRVTPRLPKKVVHYRSASGTQLSRNVLSRMTEDNEINSGIRKLRRRKRLPILISLLFLIVVLMLSFLENRIFLIKSAYFLFALSIIFSLFLFYYTKCPRCKRYFQGLWGLLNPFRNECVHCGLRIVKKSFFRI